jgi:hypothetical protein
MKTPFNFKKINIAHLLGALLFQISILSACNFNENISMEDKLMPVGQFNSASFYSGSTEKSTGNMQTVTLMDKGLNMPMGTITVPNGWKVNQDIVSTRHTPGYDRYKLEIVGPAKELVIFLPSNIQYSQYRDPYSGATYGFGFEELVQSLSQHILPEKSTQLSMSRMSISREILNDQEFQKFAGKMRQQGVTIEPFESKITGNINGQTIAGKAVFLKADYSGYSQGMGTSGMLLGGQITITTPQNLSSLQSIVQTFKLDLNPQWDTAKSRIIDQQTAQMTANHQQRMANQNASFNAQQQAHRETQAAYQSQNDAWYDRNLGAGSQYNSSAAFTDAITGHTSFNDPYSGHQTKQEGHYNYWYTNQQGEYYGTDDASFNPASLQGNWQSIQPLTPKN